MPQNQNTDKQSNSELGTLVGLVSLAISVMGYKNEQQASSRVEEMHAEAQSVRRETTQAIHEATEYIDTGSPDAQVELLKLRVELARAPTGETLLSKLPTSKHSDVFRVINRGDSTAKKVKYRWRINEVETWSGESIKLQEETIDFHSFRKNDLIPGEQIEYTVLPVVLNGVDIAVFPKAYGAFVLSFEDKKGKQYLNEYYVRMSFDGSGAKATVDFQFKLHRSTVQSLAPATDR